MRTADYIIAKLDEIFSPMDAEVLASTQTWAKSRVQALREFKASAEAEELRRDQWKYYPRLFAIAGGKTWYNRFDGRTAPMIEEAVAKHCASVVKARNAAIAAKLEKAGVTEVVSEEFTHTRDGFNGVFVVNTDAGRKRIKVDTILAGGYNIQCLHLRVLVSVK